MAAPPSETEISAIQKARVPAGRIDLPARAGSWERGERVTHDAETIFDYMDGAAEIYLGYQFDRLDVVEYVSATDEPIVAELYWMTSSDDAYGLMSLDGSGDAVALTGDGGGVARHASGLLRLWSGTLYARIIARHETNAARDAMFEIARAVVARRDPNIPPSLVSRLPRTVAPKLHLSGTPPRFVRSHLVLNSLHFLTDENVLALGLEAEAALAGYEDPATGGEIEVIVVRYPGPEAAHAVHQRLLALAGNETGNARAFLAPGSRPVLRGRTLVVVLGSPTNGAADALVEAVATAIEGISR